MLKTTPILSALLFFANISWAEQPGTLFQDFPFAQRLNMNAVQDIVTSQPQDLIAKINKYNVEVLLVRTKNPTQPLNPLLSSLPEAPQKLLDGADFKETYQGRMIGSEDPCCNTNKDTLLIRDTASSYTLIHEFLHSQLKSLTPTTQKNLETEFANTYRRLTFYQRKLMADPEMLISPLWRHDILEVQNELVDMLFERIQIGQSQEAIIERVLAQLIDSQNSYYDRARQEKGEVYGETMINNAIDIFNNIHLSLLWGQNTVRGLNEAITAGDLDKSNEKTLSSKDAEDFQGKTKQIFLKLDPVKAELLKLKDFYSKH